MIDNSQNLPKIDYLPKLTKNFLKFKNISPKFLYNYASTLINESEVFQINKKEPFFILSNKVSGGHSKIWGACIPDFDDNEIIDMGFDVKEFKEIKSKFYSSFINNTNIEKLLNLKDKEYNNLYSKTPLGKLYEVLKEQNDFNTKYNNLAVNFNKHNNNFQSCGDCLLILPKYCWDSSFWIPLF